VPRIPAAPGPVPVPVPSAVPEPPAPRPRSEVVEVLAGIRSLFGEPITAEERAIVAQLRVRLRSLPDELTSGLVPSLSEPTALVFG
jgi:hypothetical protein